MNRITELALRAAAVRWYALHREKPGDELFLSQAREAEAELEAHGKPGAPAHYRVEGK